jgi:hypothetical protein
MPQIINSPNRAAFRAWLVATVLPLLFAVLYYTIAGDYSRELIRVVFWTVPFGLFMGLLVRAAAFPTLVDASPARRMLVVGSALVGAGIFGAVAALPFGAWAGPYRIPLTILWAIAGVLGAAYAVWLGTRADLETPASIEPAAQLTWNVLRWLAPFAMLLALKSGFAGVQPYDYADVMSIPMSSRLPYGVLPADTPRQTRAATTPADVVVDDSALAAMTPEDSAQAYDGMYMDDDSLTVGRFRIGFAVCHKTCNKATGAYLRQMPDSTEFYHPAAQLQATGSHVRLQTAATQIGTIRIDGDFTIGPDEFSTEARSGEPVFEGTVTVERDGAVVYSGSHKFVSVQQAAP